MAYVMSPRDVYEGKPVKHCLFEHYGIGRILEIKRQGCREGGTECLCEFPIGKTIWLKVHEVKNDTWKHPERGEE